jgi:hypothetical protein
MNGGLGGEQAGLNPQTNVKNYGLKNLLTGGDLGGI